MVKKKPKLKDLKKVANIRKPKANKYEECLKGSLPALIYGAESHQINRYLKTLIC